MRRTYGPHWFRQLELGYMILVFILIEAMIIGAILIILPLLWDIMGRMAARMQL